METYYERLNKEIEELATTIANLTDKVNDEDDFVKYYNEIIALYDHVFGLARTIDLMKIEGRI